MSLVLQARNNETPDSTQPITSAVTGNSNTGHADTTSSVSIGSEEENEVSRTCRFFSLSSVAASKATLKFNWSLSGSLTLTAAAPGTTIADALFLVEYSVNNGASWSAALTKSFSSVTNGTVPLSDSGSVTLNIPAANTGLVQIRDRIKAHAASAGDPTVAASASITAQLNTLQLEVVPVLQPIVIM